VEYAELVEYLLQRAGALEGAELQGEEQKPPGCGNVVACKANLGFEGANQVVFTKVL
jgi:hypothetical protein